MLTAEHKFTFEQPCLNTLTQAFLLRQFKHFCHIHAKNLYVCTYLFRFGPTKERDGTWRIKTNDELDELIRHKNIINHIKVQRLS
jgi:hypothetical protein